MLLFLSLFATLANAEIKVMPSVPPSIRKQLSADLVALRELAFRDSVPLYKSIFTKFSPFEFLSAHNPRVEFDERRCGNDGVACANEYGAFATITLSPRYIAGTFPQIMRTAVLLHESRHTEKGGNKHEKCPIPYLNEEDGTPLISRLTGIPLAGKPACDESDKKAYGTQLAFFQNIIENCTNCTEKVKEDAGFYLVDVKNRIYSYRSDYSKLINK